jgi:hypothetical protein
MQRLAREAGCCFEPKYRDRTNKKMNPIVIA